MQVLHVVAVLVGDDVLSSQVTGGTELVLQLGQEVEVEVDELVGGTVEGPDLPPMPARSSVPVAPEKNTVSVSSN